MPKQHSRSKKNPAAILQHADELLHRGECGIAIDMLTQAAKRLRSHRQIHCLLAETHARQGHVVEALQVLDGMIVTGIADSNTWKLTANLLASVKEFAQAADAYEHSIQSQNSDPDTIHEYGRSLFKLGRVSTAAKQFEKAIALRDDLHFWRSLAVLAPGNPEYSHQDVLDIRRRFSEHLLTSEPNSTEKSRKSLSPSGSSLSGSSLSKTSRNISSPNAPSPTKPHANARKPRSTKGQIRIGYISAWFHRENYMKPVWALLNGHDRDRFEIHLFADKLPAKETGFRKRSNDVIHDISQLSNAEVRELVADQHIDVLIDLNAYSTPERLGIFHQRAAPVTAAWFNMYATSGFECIDYIVGDRWTTKQAEEKFYCERVVRLPQSYLSFTVTHEAPDVVDPPCLKQRHVTFGSLVAMYKITDPVVDAWARILAAVPDARFVFGNVLLDSQSNCDYLASRFEAHGIDGSRLEFLGKAPHVEFLEYYNAIDIALDSFPYSGGTTTTEALWQGLPVITFDGDRWASRTSASLLSGTHLADFVAPNLDGYIQFAVDLATSADRDQRLQRIRHTMRDNLLKSSVCDAASLTREMESQISRMCQSKSQIS